MFQVGCVGLKMFAILKTCQLVRSFPLTLGVVRSGGSGVSVSALPLRVRQENTPRIASALALTSTTTSLTHQRYHRGNGLLTRKQRGGTIERVGGSEIRRRTDDRYDSFSTTMEAAVNEQDEPSALSEEKEGSSISFDDDVPTTTTTSTSAGTGALTDMLAIDPADISLVPSFEATSSDDNDGFVKMFRGSANYIANHRDTVVVYHIPGEVLSWDGFSELIDDIALTWILGMKLIIVVGCRHQVDARMEGRIPSTPKQVSTRAATANTERVNSDDPTATTQIRGRALYLRVTSESTLRIVKEEAGCARFEVERQITRALRGSKKENGLRVNVVSGNFYSAQPFGVVDGIDYRYTGLMRRVESDQIATVHAADDIVLMTSLGFSPSGEMYTVDSEALAAGVAASLSASKLIYFTAPSSGSVATAAHISFVQRSTGSNDDSDDFVVAPLHNLRMADARRLLKHCRLEVDGNRGYASLVPDEVTGVLPDYDSASISTLMKLGWSVEALGGGVKRAHVIAPTGGALLRELYTRDGAGTMISRDLYDGIRMATVDDAPRIHNLIEPLVQKGTLVKRPIPELEKNIHTYYVYTRDDMVVAVGQLMRFEGGVCELGCLVVHPDYRREGRGDAMLGFLERLCLRQNVTTVFVLSTQTMEWFVERGFLEAPVESLPPSRRVAYDHHRQSKIYMKSISDRRVDEEELVWDH